MKLLPQIARGDLHALELLYEQQKTRIYRLALSITADTYLAEDITQETFLRIQNQASSYRNDISETAWTIMIARNLAYDILRKRRHEIVSSDAIPPDAFALPDTVEQSDLAFLDLIKDLSQQEKEIICLRILADLPWKEIGHITGQSSDAGRKCYTRSLKKLHDQLDE